MPDMTPYIMPLTGGLMIGLAAAGLMFLLGRIAGIAGILWSTVTAQADNLWRWCFLAGLLLGAWLLHLGTGIPYPEPSSLPPWQAAVGGLVVGIGVKMGSGCTSGHGVCGIGRLSPRSLVATIMFMVTGVATVYVVRHLVEGLV